MSQSLRAVQRRRKSVSNTRKMTRAMELVSAAKMRRAVQSALQSRAYVEELTQLRERVQALVDVSVHPWLGGRKVPTRSLLVVFASHRGLCGAFNAQLAKQAQIFLKTRTEAVRVVTVSRFGEVLSRRAGWEIAASFQHRSDMPAALELQALSQYLVREFVEKRTDRVFLAYTQYHSALRQEPIIRQLIPLVSELEMREVRTSEERDDTEWDVRDPKQFEPSPVAVFEHLAPRIVEFALLQAAREASASEHAARMLAMRTASDNATELIQDLSMTYNQARQAGITREISEISAGKAALELN